jgi:transaldolase
MSSLQALAKSGVAVWLDDLSRSFLSSGELEGMVADGKIVGITTTPTIFAKSISAGAGYEQQLRESALRGTAIGETLRLLTAWDVRAACDILRPVYEGSGKRDGRVSRSTHGLLEMPSEQPRRREVYGGWLIDPISSSRSPLPALDSLPSQKAWLRASASMSR